MFNQTQLNQYEVYVMISPLIFPLAMRFVATSLMVLCETPEDRMLATRQALQNIKRRHGLEYHYINKHTRYQ